MKKPWIPVRKFKQEQVSMMLRERLITAKRKNSFKCQIFLSVSWMAPELSHMANVGARCRGPHSGEFRSAEQSRTKLPTLLEKSNIFRLLSNAEAKKDCDYFTNTRLL
uniref:Uncharacterized protein n=1 Tax=Romanomermis culicivorax TaxID=13658 RepID=A0A915HTN5_ROMCU